jgi:hypothetical protein
MRSNFYLLAIGLAIAAGVVLLVLRHGGRPASPEAERIIGVAEKMAVSPDLPNPAKIAEEFGLPLELSVQGERPTGCPGHPIQLSQGWQLPPHRSPWFVKDSQEKPQPMFLLQLEPEPEVCPTDPLNLPIVAQFSEVQEWRCIHISDLGPIADRFKMTHERLGSHVEAREIARPDGRKAELNIIFYDHRNGMEGCLFSVAVTVRGT